MAIHITQSYNKDTAALVKNFKYIEERIGPQATAKSLSIVATTSKGVLARQVRDEARLMYIYKKQQTYIGQPGDPAVKMKHVSKRVFVQRASVKKLRAKVKGYTKNMPAIRIAERNPKVVKRFYVTGATHTKKKGHKIGGLRVGRRTYPGAFLNRASPNNTFQFFIRLQRRTWQKGHSGWKDWRKGDKNRNVFREPYAILRYDIKTPFDKTKEVVDAVFAARFAREYERQFAYYSGRALSNYQAKKRIL